MYTIEERVRFSETDQSGTLNLTGIVNYFQDCSTMHSEDIGWGVRRLHEENRAWILSSWQVIVERYPKAMEEILVSTWPTSFERLFGIRNFVMKTKEGGMLACANSVWIYMDMENGKPARVPTEMIQAYGQDEPLRMEYAPRKIRAPKTWENLPSFPVRRCCIDTNGHVNNGKYVEMALEYMDCPEKIRQLRVEYRLSAVLGEDIYPKTAADGAKRYVNLCNEDGKTYAMIEFTGEE